MKRMKIDSEMHDVCMARVAPKGEWEISDGSLEEVAEEEELDNGKHILKENQLRAKREAFVKSHREMVRDTFDLNAQVADDTAETFQGDLPASQNTADDELKKFMAPACRSSAFEAPKR